jgi:hypothetical protein
VQLFSNFSRLTFIVKPLNAQDLILLGASVGPNLWRNPLPTKTLISFSQPGQPLKRILTPDSRFCDQPKTPVPRGISAHCFSLCTKSCHPPVNVLHSIENKSHKLAIFSLTQILKGVQQDRSLTVS